MNQIRHFYKRNSRQEWRRLVKDYFHRLELETSLFFLDKYLPKKGHILDAGGGPGRYTIELAKRGYEVSLLDRTPELLKKAGEEIKKAKVEEKVKTIVEGSITELTQFPDQSFEAVICLGGPLSHLENEKERQKAVAELVRVTKKGGLVFVSVMGRLGVMIDMCLRWPKEIEMSRHFASIWQKGDDKKWNRKYFCHYFLPEELENLFLKQNIKMIDRVGLEGFSHVPKKTNALANKYLRAGDNWLKAHWQYCNHPAIYATSGHMMLVGRKEK